MRLMNGWCCLLSSPFVFHNQSRVDTLLQFPCQHGMQATLLLTECIGLHHQPCINMATYATAGCIRRTSSIPLPLPLLRFISYHTSLPSMLSSLSPPPCYHHRKAVSPLAFATNPVYKVDQMEVMGICWTYLIITPRQDKDVEFKVGRIWYGIAAHSYKISVMMKNMEK